MANCGSLQSLRSTNVVSKRVLKEPNDDKEQRRNLRFSAVTHGPGTGTSFKLVARLSSSILDGG